MSTINLQGGNTLLQSGFFPPARVASTGSPLTPTTGGLLVVDGVQLVAGDRVLCKDETSAVNNGLYAAATGPWTRTSDASQNTQFFSGMGVVVALGTVNAKAIYLCTCTDDPVVVGTSLITFATQLPVGAGNVSGPGSSTSGDVATFADATGKVLADTGVTGSGSVVKATSPTLVTPTIGAATATTVNKVTITQPASAATLTISDGKTLSATKTLTLAGTDGKTLTVNNSLTIAGTDGKTLTLTTGLVVTTNDGTLAFNTGGSTITFQGTDIYVGRTTTDTLTNKTFDTGGTGNVFKIGGTTATTPAQIQTILGIGRITFVARGVNFNSANTDTAIAITLPNGVTNYKLETLHIANASASISTATFGLFSAVGGGGTALIAGGTAITVTTASANTANNAMVTNGSTTTSYNFATLQFRVGTAQGSPATADVVITLIPL